MPSEQHQTLTWYYKPIDMLVINFAVIFEDVPHVVRFVDQTGYVFDRMTFDANTSLHDELIRNGFKEVADETYKARGATRNYQRPRERHSQCIRRVSSG